MLAVSFLCYNDTYNTRIIMDRKGRGIMNSEKRKKIIVKELENSKSPITASTLASICNVSRQIIVGDVALLRASGCRIKATARGYLLQPDYGEYGYVGIIACKHDESGLKDELYTIVDFGGTAIDVKVEHSLYGELSAELNLSSRYDVDKFIYNLTKKDTKPLSSLSGGIHLHSIGCPSREIFDMISGKLDELGIKFDADI